MIDSGHAGKCWRCNLCSDRANAKDFSCSTTTHIANHLHLAHQIPKGSKPPPMQAGQKTIPSLYQPQHEAITADIFQCGLVEMILLQRLPFDFCESEAVRSFIKSINPLAINYVPKSRTTVCQWAIRRFHDARTHLAKKLQDARSNIHLSFDVWTSPNYLLMLAIVGHWCGDDGQYHTALLALPEIKGHTGQIQAVAIFEVTEMYNISTKIGWLVLDNATSNGKTIRCLEQEIRCKYNQGFDVDERRLRCFGHILNLVVRALLFGSNIIALKSTGSSDDSDNDTDNDNDKAESLWCSHGAVGKLHNIVKYIRRTPQRRAGFMAVQLEVLQQSQAFMLCADNDTRWNSTYDMIVSAIQMREAVDTYMLHSLGNYLHNIH